MKKLFLAALLLTACSQEEIPPVYYGQVIDKFRREEVCRNFGRDCTPEQMVLVISYEDTVEEFNARTRSTYYSVDIGDTIVFSKYDLNNFIDSVEFYKY